MLGESSLENLPAIEDPDEENAHMEEEEEESEPQKTLEEELMEIVQNILNKSPPIAVKAMKDLEQRVSSGENIPEILEAANQLVEIIQEECDGQLNFTSPTKCHLVNFLLLRMGEERVNMKKAAILALQALYLRIKDPAIVNVCAERLALKCRDLALAIRKQAALTLTKLLQATPEFDKLRTAWLHAVMHLIVDREPGVQQYASKLISEVLIDPIMRNEEDGLVWTLLSAIEEEADLRRLLLRTLVHLHKEKALSSQIVKILLKKASEISNLANPCWMMLSELSAFFDVSPNVAIEHWTDRLDLGQPNRLIGYMAKVIGNRAENLSFQQRNFLKGNITEALMKFKIHPTYIPAVYLMFARVMRGIGGESAPGYKDLQTFNRKFFEQIFTKLDKMLYATQKERYSILEQLQLEMQIKQARGEADENQAGGEDGILTFEGDENQENGEDVPIEQLMAFERSNTTILASPARNGRGGGGRATELRGTLSENSEKIIRLLSSLGECILYTPALINRDIFKLLQAIIASDVLQKVHQEQIDQATPMCNTPAMTPMRGAYPYPGFPMSPNTSFHTELPGLPVSGGPSIAPSHAGGSPTHSAGTGEEGGSQAAPFQMRIKKRVFRSELMTRQVRATAIITLGKLCLSDEQLAKKCIPVFMRELKNNSDHFVRSNIVVVICDLCIRYTSMVDRYSTILASCLRDQSILIRRQTLMLLTNLIKEQYLIWGGPIIYRFVTTLLDSDPCIQQYANFCLEDILMPQFKERMFFHHFLECVFMFNDVRHASWIPREGEFALDSLDAEVDKQCSLEGRTKFEQRMKLYKYMLNTFEDHQKVSILEKIGLEVFVPIVEGGMKLADLKVRNLLYDAFKIMSSPEIKLKLQLGKQDVNYEGDDEEPPELVKTAAKKFISTTFRKSIAESVMPHLFSMNSYLKEKLSPLARTCYTLILEMCNDHEEQLDDFLASDPRLKAEIRLDLKQMKSANPTRGGK